MYQTDPPRPAKEVLPTMYDLPSEAPEELGLPDEFHIFQPQLLGETFCPPSYPLEFVFAASDLNLYYDVRHPLWYQRPDWFGCVGVSRLYEQQELRLSYVIWQEGVSPFVVVELLSPSTEKEDLGQTLRESNQPPTKWEVYHSLLRVPYYIFFDQYTNTLRAFGFSPEHYIELDLNQPRVWMPGLKLGLGLWQGSYQGIERLWLRWYDAMGNWIPTSAEQESKRAEQEYQRAEREFQRAERLAARLRELGIDPDEI